MSSATTAPAAAPSVSFPAYTHAQIKRVVTGIMLCILLASLDQTVVIPAVPAIATDLHAYGHLSWIVSAYLVTSTAATPVIAKLSDRCGRRALLIPSIILFMLASILCALSTGLLTLIAARALQGLGGAGLMSMAQAAVADVVTPRERGRYQGYMASMWGVASVAGPVVGGWMTDHLSWRYVFWINLPLGLAAILLCDRALRLLPPPRGGRGRIDVPGAVLLICAISTALVALSWGGTEYPWLSAPVLGAAGVALLSAVVLLWQERRAADPVLPPHLFANAAFTRGVLISFCAVGMLLGITFVMPLYYQLLLGRAASGSGALLMPFLLSNVCGAFMGGQLARRVGRTKALIMSGLSVSLLGAVALAALPAGVPVPIPLAVSAVLGVGIGVTMPTVLMQVQNSAARPDVGTATGAMLFIRSMGGAAGTTLAGSLLALVFADGLARAGIAGVELGNVRAQLGALAGPAREAVLAALSGGFHAAFAGCAGLLAIGWLVGVRMQDQVLGAGAALPKDLGH